MAEISTNIILDGITLALRSAFPGSHIESNAVKQGLRQPAFIVLLVNAEVTDYPAQRKKRLPRFDVLYFPKAGREDCYGVADTLTEVLEVIDLPGGDKLCGARVCAIPDRNKVREYVYGRNHKSGRVRLVCRVRSPYRKRRLGRGPVHADYLRGKAETNRPVCA